MHHPMHVLDAPDDDDDDGNDFGDNYETARAAFNVVAKTDQGNLLVVQTESLVDLLARLKVRYNILLIVTIASFSVDSIVSVK